MFHMPPTSHIFPCLIIHLGSITYCRGLREGAWFECEKGGSINIRFNRLRGKEWPFSGSWSSYSISALFSYLICNNKLRNLILVLVCLNFEQFRVQLYPTRTCALRMPETHMRDGTCPWWPQYASILCHLFNASNQRKVGWMRRPLRVAVRLLHH